MKVQKKFLLFAIVAGAAVLVFWWKPRATPISSTKETDFYPGAVV